MENHHFFMGKLTISMVIFNSKLLNYQRVSYSVDAEIRADPMAYFRITFPKKKHVSPWGWTPARPRILLRRARRRKRRKARASEVRSGGAGCGRRREGWEEKMERTTDHEKCDVMGIEYDEIWYFNMERTCSSDTIWYNDVIVNSEMW